MSRIYLNHAATTPCEPEVVEFMLPYFTGVFGNPSAVDETGRNAAAAVFRARKEVAAMLHALPEEIYFTSGGTEANYLALRCGILAGAEKHRTLCHSEGVRAVGTSPFSGLHVITSAIEHPSVLETLAALELEGLQVTRLMPDRRGLLDPETLRRAIRPETVLISVMTVNNELGTRQPLMKMAAIAGEAGILFHTDAVQAAGHLDLHPYEDGISLLSASAHKFHGPKGIGFLYVRRGLSLPAGIPGGGQERGLRSGTEAVPLIAGLGEASRLATLRREAELRQLSELRRFLVEGLLDRFPDAVLQGADGDHQYPGIVSAGFPIRDAKELLIRLDQEGISCSAGSACHTGSARPSHVLEAIGSPYPFGTLRFSLGSENTVEELEVLLDTLERLMPSCI